MLLCALGTNRLTASQRRALGSEKSRRLRLRVKRRGARRMEPFDMASDPRQSNAQ
jgi:hypothetical protein